MYLISTKTNIVNPPLDAQGNTKGWSCSGSLGFENPRQTTNAGYICFLLTSGPSMVKPVQALDVVTMMCVSADAGLR